MKSWFFYDPKSGVIATRTFYGREEELALNTPPGLVAVAGKADPRSQRFELSTGKLVDRRSPAGLNRGEIIAKIQQLESMQARPSRELHIDPFNQAARDRLKVLDVQIADLRAKL